MNDARSPGSCSGRARVRNRWALAAALDARLPQVRGRDRLLHAVRGASPPRTLRGPTPIRWGPDLEATIDPSQDGSLQALYDTQWVRPALVPILESALRPGDLFVDVGANVGIYATWAARLVGPSGSVLALEPVPQTRGWLEEVCAHNDLTWVEVAPVAVSRDEGWASMQLTEGASGLSRMSTGAGLQVEVTTLDRLLDARAPALIKIDVEGHELAVLEGARATLERTGAPVVFEAPDFGSGQGTLECVRALESLKYRVYSLTTKGLEAFRDGAYSHNLLAVTGPDDTLETRLRSARFPRSQNT